MTCTTHIQPSHGQKALGISSNNSSKKQDSAGNNSCRQQQEQATTAATTAARNNSTESIINPHTRFRFSLVPRPETASMGTRLNSLTLAQPHNAQHSTSTLPVLEVPTESDRAHLALMAKRNTASGRWHSTPHRTPRRDTATNLGNHHCNRD